MARTIPEWLTKEHPPQWLTDTVGPLTAEAWEDIRQFAITAPPLTDDQRERLRPLFRRPQ